MEQTNRVLVTRASHQGSALADRLRAFGLEPVSIPTIEIVGPSSFDVLDTALDQLEQFDWIVFSSANAVPVFLDKLRGRAMRSDTRMAAIGPSTARALAAVDFPVALIPPQAVAESLAEALLPYALQANGRPACFLLIRAEEGRNYLPGRLRAAGAQVTIASAYRTVVPQESVGPLRELFIDDRSGLRAITFTSSSTVGNLLALCEAAQVNLPDSALRVSIGPITSTAMRDAGYPPHAEAPLATVESLAETVAKALQEEPLR